MPRPLENFSIEELQAEIALRRNYESWRYD